MTTTAFFDRQLVTFRGAFVADWAIVSVLMELEFRGAQFQLLGDGRFQVVPPTVLTVDDRAFLQTHRHEARRILEYQADDRHLFSDGGTA